MPEGNEIHRWAERHEAAFGGKTVRVDGPQGRFTDSAVIDRRKLQRVMAVGKHLGYDFGRDRILHPEPKAQPPRKRSGKRTATS